MMNNNSKQGLIDLLNMIQQSQDNSLMNASYSNANGRCRIIIGAGFMGQSANTGKQFSTGRASSCGCSGNPGFMQPPVKMSTATIHPITNNLLAQNSYPPLSSEVMALRRQLEQEGQ